jgi:glutamyl-tRNA reductase
VCGPAERAALAAERLACNHAGLDELEAALVPADIVISALGTGRVVLGAPLLAATLRKRPVRPIFVIDAALPADADPAINTLDGVFLYDLADLERAAVSGGPRREAAVAAAWRVVDDELAGFRARGAARRAVPAVVALRRHFETLRAEVMTERGLDADAATRLLVNRLLHAPSEVLRGLAVGSGDVAAVEAMLRRLFRLDDEEDAE